MGTFSLVLRVLLGDLVESLALLRIGFPSWLLMKHMIAQKGIFIPVSSPEHPMPLTASRIVCDGHLLQ